MDGRTDRWPDGQQETDGQTGVNLSIFYSHTRGKVEKYAEFLKFVKVELGVTTDKCLTRGRTDGRTHGQTDLVVNNLTQ